MVDPESYARMKTEIAGRVRAERHLLDELRAEIGPLRGQVRRIQPRTTTAVSLVAADGGNNLVEFDPFLVQLVRVVDSSNNEYVLEAVTPTTDVIQLSHEQFAADGSPRSPLGRMMEALGVRDLTELSHMIRRNDHGRPVSPSWLQVYRELVEWAVLLSIVQTKSFGTDTLIVCDGLLRSKVFAGDLFRKYLDLLEKSIEEQQKRKRRLYLVGVAKHSKVLDRYRLAMFLERVLTTEYPAYVEVPREAEERAYLWSEYARGNDDVVAAGEGTKFVGGKMFFVKFGHASTDPIWPIDIFLPQRAEAQVILGYMLGDALNGFPVPFYPLCLQRAHTNAALVDFDFDVYQDYVLDGIRQLVGGDGFMLDVFRLRGGDPAAARYG